MSSQILNIAGSTEYNNGLNNLVEFQGQDTQNRIASGLEVSKLVETNTLSNSMSKNIHYSLVKMGAGQDNTTGRVSVMPKVLNNALPADFGYKQFSDTLTAIRKEVIKQTFYTIDIPQFIDVETGYDPYFETVKRYRSYNLSNDPQKFVVPANFGGRIRNTQQGFDAFDVKRKFWAAEINYTMLEAQQFAVGLQGAEELTRVKMQNTKQVADLFTQEVMAFGMPNVDATMTGLYNNSSVNVDTTTIGTSISSMDPSEFATFIGTVLSVYESYNNIGEVPNRFAIPMDDYLGLATPVSPTFPNVSKLEWLNKMFKEMTGDSTAEIVRSKYGTKSINNLFGVNKSRYILYKKSPENLVFDMPIPFTSLANMSANGGWSYQNIVYMQIGQVVIKRPTLVVYFDNLSA